MAKKPERLERFLGKNYKFHYVGHKLPIDGSVISVLPQPRQTFEDLELLAEDIKRKSLLNPLIIARFHREELRGYLEIINSLWQTNFDIDSKTLGSVKEDGKSVWYVLLAGERRLRACRLLWQEGCQECQDHFGKEFPGKCFRRHFGGNLVDVRLCVNIPPIPALFLQLSENTHLRVPAHQEAQAYTQLYRLIKGFDPSFPLARFAREVGRSPGTIKNALRFCDLPEEIQKFVEDGSLSYGSAVELTRIYEGGAESEELMLWATRVITGRYKISDLRDLVTGYLQEKASAQVSIVDLMSESQTREMQKAAIRRTVGLEFVRGLHGFLGYLEHLTGLFEKGLLGKADSPFSEKSPIKIYRRLVERELELLPHLREFLPRKLAQNIEEDLIGLASVLAVIDDDQTQYPSISG